jgi:hypothetical protein
MSKQKKKHPRAAHIGNVNTHDWMPLFGQLTGVIDWGLDIAARLSLDDDEDLDAIERVRAFVHGWLDGRRVEVPLTDVLTAIAILFAAIEIDLGIDSLALLAPLRTMRDTPSSLPAVLRCPGAARDGEPTVRIRRFPGRRNASAAFSQLAVA